MIVTQQECLASPIAMNALFEKAIEFLNCEGWRDRTDGKIPPTPYDVAKDIWFSRSARERSTPAVLTTGQLIVLFPENAHAPMHSASALTNVRKIAIKVAVSG